jgi:hypothetical protein
MISPPKRRLYHLQKLRKFRRGSAECRLLALVSLVLLLALKLSQDGNIPVPMTAWYRKGEPTCSDCLASGRWPLWRARDGVNSTAEPEFVQCPREAFELWLTGLPLAA